MAIGTGISQNQTTGLIPEHIVGKAVLKMSLLELREYVQMELAENPALTLNEDNCCPVCSSLLVDGICETCGASVVEGQSTEEQEDFDDWDEDIWMVEDHTDDVSPEPFTYVASAKRLTDHLREQIRTHLRPEDVVVADFIVDSLDEDGYLREPLYDMASRSKLSVPELEAVLLKVQNLDPPGIAARDLRECLLIQLRQLDHACPERANVELMLSEHWDLVTRMRLDEVAKRMRTDRETVERALRFVRKSLNPYPANAFYDPWQKLAPLKQARQAPDVVVRETEAGLLAEVVDPIQNRIAMDQIYVNIFNEMSKKHGHSDGDQESIRDSVRKARSLLEALEFRRTAVRTVAEEILRCQADFFLKGPAWLKPITRKQIARQVGLHESTVCRATDGKFIQLPSGEVISFDVLFDAALPVKELVKQLAVHKLSDGEISKKLADMGIKVARRTVAKYRDQVRVLPVDMRHQLQSDHVAA